MITLAEILLERPPDPFWTVLRQLGIEHAVGVLPRYHSDWRETSAERPWDYGPLAQYRDRVHEAGMELAVIEDNPPMDRLRLGLPGREEELEAILTLIRNLGALGVGVWSYNWMTVLGWLRTGIGPVGRGGAIVSSYDHTETRQAPPTPAGTVDADRLWDSLAWFLERACPVAEEAGVRLALHPDDPPISPIRGVARIMSSVDAFERAFALNPSPANAITLCQGNFALMTDDLPGLIRRFASRIAFAHVRDVRGTRERFVETFHDDGPTDMLGCLRAYHESGFDGVVRSDHVPTVAGDQADVAGYSHQARLHAIGYLTGLREAVLAQSAAGTTPAALTS